MFEEDTEFTDDSNTAMYPSPTVQAIQADDEEEWFK